MVVRNVTRKTVLANNCVVASTFYSRLKGLQFKKEFSDGCGLLIKPCNSIHMFFMRFPIDAVFIDKDNNIVYIQESIKPWRISKVVKNACCVLELPAGTVAASRTGQGDILCFCTTP